MADGTASNDKTERVVLQRVVHTPEAPERTSETVYWRERGIGRGTRQQAVAQVVGDEHGSFRAPPARSWKGIVEQAEPEKPAVQRRLIEA